MTRLLRRLPGNPESLWVVLKGPQMEAKPKKVKVGIAAAHMIAHVDDPCLLPLKFQLSFPHPHIKHTPQREQLLFAFADDDEIIAKS